MSRARKILETLNKRKFGESLSVLEQNPSDLVIANKDVEIGGSFLDEKGEEVQTSLVIARGEIDVLFMAGGEDNLEFYLLTNDKIQKLDVHSSIDDMDKADV